MSSSWVNEGLEEPRVKAKRAQRCHLEINEKGFKVVVVREGDRERLLAEEDEIVRIWVL